MFGRRRRPLARAAVVGGGAYAIGKRRARQEADDAMYEDQDAPAGLDATAMNDLERLAELKDRGVLTEREFNEQKAKILDQA